MATHSKKSSKHRISSGKKSKRAEQVPSIEPLKEESFGNIEEESLGKFMVDDEDVQKVEDPVEKEPTPEPVYEECALRKTIVESYEGEKLKGMYHGYGVAHFAGGHHYEGQFADGMMHGQGKYTWSHNLVYEGQFSQNCVTGKGSYMWPDGSCYEGYVFNGFRHGFGSFFAANKKSSFVGQWQHGKRNGKGRMTYTPDGLSFHDGDWVNNVRQGFGVRQYASGNVYEGMWFNNQRHGEGAMQWLDRNQMYSGQWEDGIQHGFGQHIWFLPRMGSSQYPLRNMYDGQFDRGLRNGFGVFHYANGARYEGNWKDNMKHGKGKFIFKNGRVYEGMFAKDHIVEFPNFNTEGISTPDLSQIRTRTPLPSEHMSAGSNESRNTYGPSFQLEVESLLQEFPEIDREEEAAQVIFVIMRYMSNLRAVYTYYSRLGFENSPDNTFVMSAMQFWRLLKDCQLHHSGVTLTEMDRVIATSRGETENIHNPHAKILFREFINYLVTLSWHIFHEEYEVDNNSPVLAWCVSKLICENVLPYSCSVKGYIYLEPRRAENAMVHMEQAYEVYKTWSVPRKFKPMEPVLKMRDFLLMMKDFKLVNEDLSAKEIVAILALDDPNVTDPEGAINLELEMTFLEFFEALVGCAQVFVTESVLKDPTTPRPSTTMTHGGRTLSGLGSVSQASGDLDVEEEETTISPAPGASEPVTPAPKASVTTTKQRETAHTKTIENQPSNITVGSAASEKRSESGCAAQQGVEPKMSTSFNPGLDEPALVQSFVSIPAQSDDLEGEDVYEEEELDEATKQFNYWTHQLHIFFVRKFFPAAQRMLILIKLVQEREAAEAASTAANPLPSIDATDTAEPNTRNDIPVLPEQSEPEVIAVH